MAEPTHKPGAPRWMRILLIVSLALNLLIIGAVAGAVSSGKPAAARVGDVSFGPYTAALDRQDLRALRRTIRQEGGRIDWSEARENFRDFLQVLREEPLDLAKMTRLFEAQSEMVRMRQDIGKEALLERIGEMTPEQRAAFADRLETALRRGRPDRS